MNVDVAFLAGGVSTVIFAGSFMPMVVKAARTRDLDSYSLGNLLLANLGNVVHSVYIYSLPAGPIWGLHAFYLMTSAFMLVMYMRHASLIGQRLHDSFLGRRVRDCAGHRGVRFAIGLLHRSRVVAPRSRFRVVGQLSYEDESAAAAKSSAGGSGEGVV